MGCIGLSLHQDEMAHGGLSYATRGSSATNTLPQAQLIASKIVMMDQSEREEVALEWASYQPSAWQRLPLERQIVFHGRGKEKIITKNRILYIRRTMQQKTCRAHLELKGNSPRSCCEPSDMLTHNNRSSSYPSSLHSSFSGRSADPRIEGFHCG